MTPITLFLQLACFTLFAHAERTWTVSSFWGISTSVDDYYPEDLYTYTSTDALTVTALPAGVTPVSISTVEAYRFSNVETIMYFIDAAAFPASAYPTSTYNNWDDETTTSTGAQTTTVFIEPYIITADDACNTAWTFTSFAQHLDVPTGAYAAALSEAESTTTLTPTSTGRYFAPTTTVAAYFTPAAESDILEALQSDYQLSSVARSCDPPTGYAYTTAGELPTAAVEWDGVVWDQTDPYRYNTDDDDDDDDDYYYNYSRGGGTFGRWRQGRLIALAVTLGIFVIGIILGFLESAWWFSRMMRGKSALRGGTICWGIVTLIAWCLCKRQRARPKDERTVLEGKWAALSFGEKFRLYRSWGLRWAYPVELLGPKPSRKRSATVGMEGGVRAAPELVRVRPYHNGGTVVAPPPMAQVRPDTIVEETEPVVAREGAEGVAGPATPAPVATAHPVNNPDAITRVPTPPGNPPPPPPPAPSAH